MSYAIWRKWQYPDHIKHLLLYSPLCTGTMLSVILQCKLIQLCWLLPLLSVKYLKFVKIWERIRRIIGTDNDSQISKEKWVNVTACGYVKWMHKLCYGIWVEEHFLLMHGKCFLVLGFILRTISSLYQGFHGFL